MEQTTITGSPYEGIFSNYSEKDTEKLYSLLSAVRGNDRDDEPYKVITTIIRSFLGIDTQNGTTLHRHQYITISLPTIYNSNVEYTSAYAQDKNEFMIRLEQVVDHVCNAEWTSHYCNHLRWAIETIGKEEFIHFVEKTIENQQ